MPGDAVAPWRLVKEFHIFSTCCSRYSLGIWTLIPRAPCSGSHLLLCVATVHGCFLTNFYQFLREKWTPITLQFTLGNLELFLRAVSGRISHTFFVLVVLASLRSSHMKTWTSFPHAVIRRWEVGFGSDAFFALLRVIQELSAIFRSPRALTPVSAGGLLHNFLLRLCDHTHSSEGPRLNNNNNNNNHNNNNNNSSNNNNNSNNTGRVVDQLKLGILLLLILRRFLLVLLILMFIFLLLMLSNCLIRLIVLFLIVS